MITLPTGVTPREARAIVITREELDCFPRCFAEDKEPDPSHWVPVVPPWAPPDWGTEAYDIFRVKVLKARKWWAANGAPPNPLPTDEAYARAERALEEKTAKPVEVALDEEEEPPPSASPEAPANLAPAGSGDYVVRAGDCMASIAFAHGFAWSTLWNHPANAELKKLRKDPDVLFPGDRVTIPPLRPRVENRPTTRSHKFRLKSTPARLNLVLRWGGQPRAGEPYELQFGAQVRRGTLGGNGELSEPIAPSVTHATLIVGEGDRRTELALRIGALKPATALEGAQSRLFNLGYLTGSTDGRWNDRTRRALRRFQRDMSLEPTGELNDATIARLIKAHDSAS